MYGLTGPHLVVIAAVALLVFGPKKLPEIGRAIGEGLRELRKTSREITHSLDIEDADPPAKELSDGVNKSATGSNSIHPDSRRDRE